MEIENAKNTNDISLAELANDVRSAYSRTGQVDDDAIARIVGSKVEVIEFSSSEPTDLLSVAMSNIVSNNAG